ncbi:MAG: hypothetical protein HY302_03945 [Opitutae bacterium]|nr:hypothetical protein [Opitutae bacterium]
MPAGVDDGDDDGAFSLDKIIDDEVVFRDQSATIVVKFYRAAPWTESDLISYFKVTLKKLVGSTAGVCREKIKGQLHVVTDRLQRDHGPAVHLRRWIDFFNSTIESVATLPAS